jgi:O-antigen ligase
MNDMHQDSNKLWFALTLLFLAFDYGRPHDIVPVLRHAHPLMILTLLLGAFLLVRSGFDFFWNPQLICLWIFIGLTGLHIPFAVNRRYAFRTFIYMALYMPFILSIVFTVTDVERVKKVMRVGAGMMIVVAVYSIMHSGRGQGNYFSDENDVSLFLCTWLPFCYFLLMVDKSKWARILYSGGLVAGLFGVVASFSRGGFVGLLAMTGVVWIFSRKKIAALAGIAVLSLVVFIAGDTAYWNEMSTVTDTEESTANTRILSWEAGWDMFLDNPLGVGGNNFQIRFPEYQSPEFTRDMYGRVAHSLWFTLIPELGILGIFVFLALLIFNLRSLFRIISLSSDTDEPEAEYLQALGRAFLAAFAGFFASATFVSVLYYAHYWYLTAFIIAVEEIVMESYGYDSA